MKLEVQTFLEARKKRVDETLAFSSGVSGWGDFDAVTVSHEKLGLRAMYRHRQI